MKLSIVISAFNESHRIEKSLKAASFADEIIFVDNTSSDDTVKIAKKYTKHVLIRPNNPMLNVNKNYGISHATGDWILVIDADEVITPELAKEIQQKIQTTQYPGYWIPRKNIIFGKWIRNSIWWPDYQLRLFKKGAGKFAEKHVHEMLTIVGETEKLSAPLEHDNYSSISQYLYKLDKIYTESEVVNALATGKKVTWIDAFRYPVEDFLKTFFAQQGYKDGLHGLVLSILQAFYSFVVFAKIWEKQGFTEYNSPNFLQQCYQEMQKIGKEVKYWVITAKINHTKEPIKKVIYKFLRKQVSNSLQ